jgi:hypothetical protein
MSDVEVMTTMPAPALGRANVAYVDWAAILAGSVVAAAIFTVMTTFGAAIGLAAVSPISGSRMSGTAWAIATALWVLWIAVSSFIAGGYIAGRMRHRVHDATEHESDVRDGVHGLVVWGIGALLIGYLAASSVAGLTRNATDAASNAGNGVHQGFGLVDEAANQLLRSNSPNSAATDTLRKDVASVLASSAITGSMSDEDKAYLASQVAPLSGLPPAEAAKRVDEAMAGILVAAEKARKFGILVAFLTAASLAVSAAAAWWAASMGGKHRDEGVDLSYFTAWR